MIPLSGWKTYVAAIGLAATGLAKYLGHEIDFVGLLQVFAEALAVVGIRDVFGRLLTK